MACQYEHTAGAQTELSLKLCFPGRYHVFSMPSRNDRTWKDCIVIAASTTVTCSKFKQLLQRSQIKVEVFFSESHILRAYNKLLWRVEIF